MNDNWEKNSSSEFIKKPGKGWLHSDIAVQEGISYNVKYVGCIGINESMKSLSFEVRTQVARESIRRVAEAARLLNLPRRNRRNDDSINKILSTNCITQWSGMNVELHINTQFLKVTQLECNDILFQHTMQNISFACGGDTDIQDYVAYVAKDEINGRACYVFECSDNSANNVITTVGQAFELRFRKFLSSMPNIKNKSLSPTSSSQLESTNTHNLHTNQHNLHSSNHSDNNNSHHNNNSNHHHHHNVINNHQMHHKNTPQSSNMASNSAGVAKKFSPEQIKNNNASKSTTSSVTNSSSNHTNSNSNHTSNNQLTNGQQTNGTKFKLDEKLEKMPWFHGLLTRENAEKLLLNDGDYLVRETNKAERQYVLSGRYKGECRHIFLVDPSGVVRTKDRVFDNICHLIQYHQDNNIPIISKENELLLENPICR